MTRLKSKEIKKMSKEERKNKLEELKLELIRAKIGASKAGTSKIREIKRLIARILTTKEDAI